MGGALVEISDDPIGVDGADSVAGAFENSGDAVARSEFAQETLTQTGGAEDDEAGNGAKNEGVDLIHRTLDPQGSARLNEKPIPEQEASNEREKLRTATGKAGDDDEREKKPGVGESISPDLVECRTEQKGGSGDETGKKISAGAAQSRYATVGNGLDILLRRRRER